MRKALTDLKHEQIKAHILDPENSALSLEHQFYIVVNVENTNVKIDINNLKKIPHEILAELNIGLFGGKEITDIDAQEIMDT